MNLQILTAPYLILSGSMSIVQTGKGAKKSSMKKNPSVTKHIKLLN